MFPIAQAVDSARPLILVGDDDPLVRTLVRRVLEREGFELLLVDNGRDVIEELARRRVDLVLLDVNMPVKNGLQTLHEIRADDRFRTLPIILITGSASEADRVRGLESGANDFLVKPFAIEELAARVRAQFRSQAAWTHQLARGREDRRRLAASLDTIPRDVPLVLLASTLVERLSRALDVDGVAILHFTRGLARTIASGGALRSRFLPTHTLPRAIGRDVAVRAQAGPWLDDTAAWLGASEEAVEVAYVPFRLGPSPRPLGCLVYALRPGSPTGPLSHRLADLIDATDFIVAVLRPAVEQAESTDAALSRIQRLIARRDFAIHLQPIVRLDDGSVMAVEALARFASGLPPDVQFAEAATLGLGLALERAALSAAIDATATLPKSVALSANLSGHVIQNDEALGEALGAAGRDVIVELTEHEPIDDYAAVRAALAGFGPAVKLAVDDAGSGYSSLRHILALQPAYVKLDMEWVRGIDRDPVRRALVTGLDYFARETGCELIAEGIETEAELAAIRELGIPYGQGYLLGRPEPSR